MKCPYVVGLQGLPVLICKAGEKPYAPSPFQLHEYCKSKYHKRCPFFLNAIRETRISSQLKDAVLT